MRPAATWPCATLFFLCPVPGAQRVIRTLSLVDSSQWTLTSKVTFGVSGFLREGADVGGLWAWIERRGTTRLRSALQAEALDGENNSFMQMLNQALRPFKQRVYRVKGQFGHLWQHYESCSASLQSNNELCVMAEVQWSVTLLSYITVMKALQKTELLWAYFL